MPDPIGPNRGSAPPARLVGLDILPTVPIRPGVTFDQLADLCRETGFYLPPGETPPTWTAINDWPNDFGKDSSVYEGSGDNRIKIISDEFLDRAFYHGTLVKHPANLPDGVLNEKFLTDTSYRVLAWMNWGKVEMVGFTFLVPPSFIAAHGVKKVNGEESTRDRSTFSTATEWTEYLRADARWTFRETLWSPRGNGTKPASRKEVNDFRNRPLSAETRTSLETTLNISPLPPVMTMAGVLEMHSYHPTQEVIDALNPALDPNPTSEKFDPASIIEELGLTEPVERLRAIEEETEGLRQQMLQMDKKDPERPDLLKKILIQNISRGQVAVDVYDSVAGFIEKYALDLDAGTELLKVAWLTLEHEILVNMTEQKTGKRKYTRVLAADLGLSTKTIQTLEHKLTLLCGIMVLFGVTEWEPLPATSILRTSPLAELATPTITVDYIIRRHMLREKIGRIEGERELITKLTERIDRLKTKGKLKARLTAELKGAKKVHGQNRSVLVGDIIYIVEEYGLSLDQTLEFFEETGLLLEHTVLANMTKAKVGERKTRGRIAKEANIAQTSIRRMEQKFEAELIEPFSWNTTPFEKDVGNLVASLKETVMTESQEREDLLEDPLDRLLDAVIDRFNMKADVARLQELKAEQVKGKKALEGKTSRQKRVPLRFFTDAIFEVRTSLLDSVINIAMAAGLGPIDSIEFLNKVGLDYETEMLRTMVVDEDSVFAEIVERHHLYATTVRTKQRDLQRLFDKRRESVIAAISTEDGFEQLAGHLRMTPSELEVRLLADADGEGEALESLRAEVGNHLVGYLKATTELFSHPEIVELVAFEENDEFRTWAAEQITNPETNPFRLSDDGIEGAVQILIEMRVSGTNGTNGSNGTNGKRRGRGETKIRTRSWGKTKGRGLIGVR